MESAKKLSLKLPGLPQGKRKAKRPPVNHGEVLMLNEHRHRKGDTQKRDITKIVDRYAWFETNLMLLYLPDCYCYERGRHIPLVWVQTELANFY